MEALEEAGQQAVPLDETPHDPETGEVLSRSGSVNEVFQDLEASSQKV
jgi:hypothetical protein